MRNIALLAAALAFAACSKSESTPKPEPAQHIPGKVAKDPATAKQMIAQGAVVLDVRSPDEFGEGHLPMATNIPVSDVTSRLDDVSKLAGGDKTKPIVVYCAAGGRAAKAKTALEKAGYTNVVNGGGYDDLK